IPAGHHEADRVAVLEGQGLTVHGVGEQGLALAGGVEGETSLEVDRAGVSLDRPAVGPAEHSFSGPWQDAGPVEDLGEWDAGPLRGADRPQSPGVAVDR